MKHNLLIALDDRGKISCHKVHININITLSEIIVFKLAVCNLQSCNIDSAILQFRLNPILFESIQVTKLALNSLPLQVNLCFLFFNPKDCVEQLGKVLAEKPDEGATNGEVFDREAYLR